MTRAQVRFLSIVAAAVLALACGQTPPGAASSSTAARSGLLEEKQLCALLTADDIQSVLGTAPAAPRYEKPQCIWASADGSNEHLVGLIVTGASHRSYPALAQAYRETMDGADPAEAMHPIEGAGGLFAVGFNEMPMVQIYTSSSMVQVATFGNEEQHALELAKKAVARLE